MFNYGHRLQPLVVIVGSLKAPEASYVVVDKVVWKVGTALKAIDICFKTFHVLHTRYPAETYSWLLVQRLVYKFETKWDLKSPIVSALLSEFC